MVLPKLRLYFCVSAFLLAGCVQLAHSELPEKDGQKGRGGAFAAGALAGFFASTGGIATGVVSPIVIILLICCCCAGACSETKKKERIVILSEVPVTHAPAPPSTNIFHTQHYHNAAPQMPYPAYPPKYEPEYSSHHTYVGGPPPGYSAPTAPKY